MGWAPGDSDKVVSAKVALAYVKDSLYKLKKILDTIEHPEKGPALISTAHDMLAKADQIEIHLNR